MYNFINIYYIININNLKMFNIKVIIFILIKFIKKFLNKSYIFYNKLINLINYINSYFYIISLKN